MAKFDLVVLGSGPAGRRAAIQAAKLGRSVLVVDDRKKVGGVSLHTGTIPSKTLRETALNLSGWRERGFYGAGHRAKQVIESDDLAARMAKTFDYEVSVLEHQFARNGVRTMVGRGRFESPHKIAVDREMDGQVVTEVVHAEKVLICVGTAPYRPDHIPFNGTSIVDSDDFITSPRLPRSLAVVGGGVIGIEYATIFSAMDVPVTLIEPREQLLPFLDAEIVDHLVHLMRDRGIALRMGGSVEQVSLATNGNPVCILSDGRQVASEMVLFTAGRIGATGGLNLAAAGLEPDDRGRLEVDRTTFQTSQPHIYAAGDVIGFPSLASTSMEQGRAAACHAFGTGNVLPDTNHPYGVYAVPELSSVGMTEQQAREQGLSYECGIARFRETSRGHIMGMEYGVLKLVCHRETRRVLGVHIIGEGASELVHIGQAVIALEGTVDYFVENSFNYPTLAEGYKVAALDVWNRLQTRLADVVELKPRKRTRKG
ncbi:MAG: Si-specific NAD(P)(+) transhydrogenase [Sphingomonadaceae bacterium]